MKTYQVKIKIAVIKAKSKREAIIRFREWVRVTDASTFYVKEEKEV